MKYFKLPDLGEGLQEAEIVEWHIAAGDTVEVDQVILSVETAKAIVEIPAPQAGEVAKLFGAAGELVHVGEPLLEYANADDDDKGTVVGEMQSAGKDVEVDRFIIGSPNKAEDKAGTSRIMATPQVRALARRLKVDLAQVKGTGRQGMITAADVENVSRSHHDFDGAVPLKGVRRSMAKNMSLSHAEVVSVSLHDDVDIHAWRKGEDVTMRLVRAIATGCVAEPNLNGWFDGHNLGLKVKEEVDLGIAVDTPEGLFVPVLRNVSGRSPEDLRKGLDNLRAAVIARSIPLSEMVGASITLSNFGTLAGRYSNPVIVPPMIAIIGAGRIRSEVVPVGESMQVHRMLPLSLSFDHRAVTGGEAARFLAAMMKDLAQES